MRGFGQFLLLWVEGGLQQQVGHAQHPDHRGADFMAHVGQELGFGLAGRFGSPLGLFQLGDGPAELAVGVA